MNVLGISAFYHDSAAALVRDGEIVAAAQEERFSRKKHDATFPAQAIAYCLREAALTHDEVDLVAFYEKPLLKFDRIVETYMAYAPSGFQRFVKSLPIWLKQKLYIPRELDRGLGRSYKGRYVFLEHHESHAASAFFPSPFDEAAILTLDGVGEWATGSIAIGRGHHIKMLKELRFPHSLGLLYSAFTYYTGFKVNSGEYKVMGLAPYGKPIFKDRILHHLLDLKHDGSFRMNMDYFGFGDSDRMTSAKFDALFDGPPRAPESALGQREMDLAASIQAVAEEVVLRMAHHTHEVTGCEALTMAGGVALNCVANGRLLREGPFKHLWIQPAAGDAGGALGSALFTWHQLLNKHRNPRGKDSQRGSLLGPRNDIHDIKRQLDEQDARYQIYDDPEKLYQTIASLIANQKIVGLVAGRMEFGPRALGARSILADPRTELMQSTLNQKIKFRESFRPFAPAVLREHASEYFQIDPDVESPYMLVVAKVCEDKRAMPRHPTAQGFELLKQPRSVIPAVTHVDDSARVQTVNQEQSPALHAILKAFYAATHCPVLINTSFNVRGEPLVNSAEDAFRCFMATELDVLVIENFLLLKTDQEGALASEQARFFHQHEQD